jgi:Rieske Fe-S protein
MSEISRRDFIKQTSILSACACCFGAVTLLDSCSTPGNISTTEKAIIETPTQITVLKTAFNNQSYIKLSTGKFNDPIFLNTNADGTYTAVLMNCSHKHCSLGASQGKFVCPCHGSEFDLEGHVLKGPAKTDLQTFQVTSDDLHVIVHYQ